MDRKEFSNLLYEFDRFLQRKTKAPISTDQIRQCLNQKKKEAIFYETCNASF